MQLLAKSVRVSRVVMMVGVVAGMGCGSVASGDRGGALMTAPSSVAVPTRALAGDSSSTRGVAGATFTMTDGVFRFTGEQGELRGTYDGVVTAPLNGSSTARMALQVTGGTGTYLGASGTIEATGQGTFAGEGQFVLTMSGIVLGGKYQATLVGDAAIGCGSDERVISRLQGQGTVATGGRVDMQLESQVVEGVCSGAGSS
jgi:hypothetical protein